MKRTALVRKTPLKTKTGLKAKTPLKAKTQLKAKTPLKAKTGLRSEKPLKASSTLGGSKKQIKRGNGLKGHGRTAEEVAHHSKVAKLGCLACKILCEKGLLAAPLPFPLRIHHTNGRKKKSGKCYSEFQVLPLCDQHHHPELAFTVESLKPDLEAPSVHGRKKLFNELVGSEQSLVLLVFQMLGEEVPWPLGGKECVA